MNRADLEHLIRAAGREKDLEFVRALLHHRLVEASEVEALLEEFKPEERERVRERLRFCVNR